METKIMKMSVNLKGIKKIAWKKNLRGFFRINGEPLSDEEVRKVIDWAIEKGYESDTDIPDEEVVKFLGLKN